MELPQPRPPSLGNQGGGGGGKATHDFLSLYSSTTTQDLTPPQGAGGYLKTHDFLQPLEREVGKKYENQVGQNAVEKPPIPVEHILPGGIGTYSISYFNQRVLKPDGPTTLFTTTTTTTTAKASSSIRNDENSNGSSYTGSGFTLWDESAIIKGKTGKENNVAAAAAQRETHVLPEACGNIVGGQWPSQSSSIHKHKTAAFSSFSTSQPSSSYKNQSFMDMITLAKNDQEEDDDDDEDDFVIKKEHSSHSKGNLSVKVEAKNIDQKPNTPCSKHSATEQRRRSKINDRFQKLREIIPNSDQKRDKASFLLEVIDYIQFLQEKATKCESSYNGWNHEPSKMMQWRKHETGEGFIDKARGSNTKFDENRAGAGVSPIIPINGQNLADSDISSATTLKQRVWQQPELASKAANVFGFGSIASDTAADKTIMKWPPPSNTIKDQELTIQSGTINISTVYSQGLLNSLTQALQSSGVDLSQANISVQIDLGKRANSSSKDDQVPASLPRPKVAKKGEEFGQALKRLRTS